MKSKNSETKGDIFRLAMLILAIALSFNTEAVVKSDEVTVDEQRIERPVKGKVVDGSGEAVIGVTVREVGTNNGAITDFNGEFSIELTTEDPVLSFSSVGFVTKEVIVANQTVIDVVLDDDIKSLEEVVVVGYGVQKKSDNTGAISSVSGSELTTMPTQRIDQALQGKAAGVSVFNTDGAPGGNTNVRIRGNNSLTGNSDALVVVDGLQGVDLKTINPSDIESVEILKDASAAAIYGSRGANGVILITTKSGESGKPKVTYNYSEGIQKLTNYIDVMDAGEFARAANEFSQTLDVDYPPSGFKPFTDEEVAYFEANGGTDWQREVYKTGRLTNHQVSIGGGTDNSSYFLSAGYMNNEGIMINSEYTRYALRAKIDTDLTNWLQVGLNWAGVKEKSNIPPFGNGTLNGVVLGQAANEAYLWDATTPVYDENGNYTIHEPGYGHDEGANPVMTALETLNDVNKVQNNVNAYLNFDLLEGLSFKVLGGAITYNDNNLLYYNTLTYEGAGVNGKGRVYTGTGATYQNSNILTYSKEFNRHSITATGVAEYQLQKTQYYEIEGRDFGTDVTGIYDLSSANILSVRGNAETKRVLNSYIGRVNYAYDNRYSATLSYRADGSSVFGENSKWGFFPSIAGAWNVSNESFFDGVGSVSNLKLRGSWGQLGNQAVSPYSTLSSLSAGANYPYDGTGSTNIGYVAATSPNDQLKWETTEQVNIGVDVGLVGDRFNLSIDAFSKKVNDALLSKQIPYYTGYSTLTVPENVGAFESQGLEIMAGGYPINNNLFQWHSNVVFFTNKSKVTDLGEGVDELVLSSNQGGGYGFSNIAWLVKGEPLGTLKGHIFEGIWGTDEEAEANKYGQMPGDPKYKDLNGDYVIDSEDFTIIAYTAPKFSLSFNNEFIYKNFELSFSLQGTFGNEMFNAGRIFTEKTNWGLLTGTSTRLLDHWTVDNQDTDIPAWTVQSERIQYNLERGITNTEVYVNNRDSRYVEDASYIRLRTLNFAYNFPKELLSKYKIQNLKLYFSGANLLTFTEYTGYDPEASSFAARGDTRGGIDNSNYPQSKTFTLGLDITF